MYFIMLTMNVTDKSSCTVEIYKATNATTIVADSGSCDYTWGNSKLIGTSIDMLMLYFYYNRSTNYFEFR